MEPIAVAGPWVTDKDVAMVVDALTNGFFHPLTSQPACAALRQQGARNRCAYDISARGISLPSALRLTAPQIDRVSDALRSLLGYPPLDRERLTPSEFASVA